MELLTNEVLCAGSTVITAIDLSHCFATFQYFVLCGVKYLKTEDKNGSVREFLSSQEMLKL